MERSHLALAEYARRREAQERAAAKQAVTLGARRAHQELAQYYAQLAAAHPEARIGESTIQY